MQAHVERASTAQAPEFIEVSGAEVLAAGPCTASGTAISGRDVQGRFRVALPECAAAVREASASFVDVQVNGQSVGERTRIGAVPFSIEAGRAAQATTAFSADEAVAASGALRTELDTLRADVNDLVQFLDAMGVFLKGANNGTQTCDTFCSNAGTGNVGGCLGGLVTSSPQASEVGDQLGCSATPTTAGAGVDVNCLCAAPTGAALELP